MKLIIGLGNPGIKYEKTRHNLGFLIVDYLAAGGQWKENKKANCLYIKKQLGSEEVELVKPQTFMNNSGLAVKLLIKYYKIPTEEIMVIHDDIDLSLGKIKIQKSRGAAGHKGVQSIIDQLKTKDFIRMRVGIFSEACLDTEKFVLKKFTLGEEKIIQKIIKRAVQMIMAAL